MAQQGINDIDLYDELTGDGDETLALVHGSWTDHVSRQFVVPALAQRHSVVTDDRRGHSRSVGLDQTDGSLRQHEPGLVRRLQRLSLVVFVDNLGAIGLYRRLGFVVEGTMVAYGFKRGPYVNAHAMARLHGTMPSAGPA